MVAWRCIGNLDLGATPLVLGHQSLGSHASDDLIAGSARESSLITIRASALWQATRATHVVDHAGQGPATEYSYSYYYECYYIYDINSGLAMLCTSCEQWGLNSSEPPGFGCAKLKACEEFDRFISSSRAMARTYPMLMVHGDLRLPKRDWPLVTCHLSMATAGLPRCLFCRSPRRLEPVDTGSKPLTCGPKSIGSWAPRAPPH